MKSTRQSESRTQRDKRCDHSASRLYLGRMRAERLREERELREMMG